jgi:hypothetical protein
MALLLDQGQLQLLRSYEISEVGVEPTQSIAKTTHIIITQQGNDMMSLISLGLDGGERMDMEGMGDDGQIRNQGLRLSRS